MDLFSAVFLLNVSSIVIDRTLYVAKQLYSIVRVYIVIIYIILYRVNAWQRGLHEIFMMHWIVLFLPHPLVLNKRVLQTKCIYIVTSILYTHIIHALVVYRIARPINLFMAIFRLKIICEKRKIY